MTEYQLQILRNAAVLPNYDTALAVLNSYQYHRIGQPVAVRYYDADQKIAVLFAIGKKDCEDIVPGEPNCGPEFYDIINRNTGAVTAVMKWRILGGGTDDDVTHAIYMGPHTDLDAEIARDFGKGTLIYCNDSVIARVKKLKESESETPRDWYEFYGQAGGGGGEANLNWKEISAEDTEGQISFKTGTQTEYDTAKTEGKVAADNLYVTTDATPTSSGYEEGAHRLYKGDQLLGDAYVSSESVSSVVATSVGGIKSGTSLASILHATQGSVSKVLDMILFPAYAPQYAGPRCSITAPTSGTIFIYDELPGIAFSTTKAYTYTSSASVLGGDVYSNTTSRSYPSGSTDDGTAVRTADALGDYTYNAKVSFNAGTELIKDTKGNPAQGYASNATTLASATLTKTHLTEATGGYVVGARTEIAAGSQTLTAINPIWVGDAGSTKPTQLSISQSKAAQSSDGLVGYTLSEAIGSSGIPSESNSWYVDVPTGKSLTVILRAIDGTYPAANTQQIKKIATNVESRHWTSSANNDVHIMVDRWVYNGSSYSGGKHKIIVS